MTKITPNPGSYAAIELGCTCPVLDNARGKGYMGQPGIFVYTMGCPVHDTDGDMFREIIMQSGQPPKEEDDA